MSKNLLAPLVLPIIVSAFAGGIAGFFVANMQNSANTGNDGGQNTAITQDAVRSAILERPEMIEEAFYALQTKRQAEADGAKRLAMADAQGALYNAKYAPVIGADDAPFVVVEFFDYNCGYCKIASQWLQTALEKNPGKIKVIMKDFPILEGRSKGSRESSEAAWAARLQGQDQYEKFHFALMDSRGGFDSARINAIAAGIGIDVAQMRADMKTNAAAFEALMDENYALAKALGIDGTPAFVAGETFISGADTEKLQALLDAAINEAS